MTKPRKKPDKTKHVTRAERTRPNATRTKASRNLLNPSLELEMDMASDVASTASHPSIDRRRALRPRPTPTFLLEQQDQDAIAKRRVLMVLRVLSGETPVTEAIEGTDITRQTYYQLEERALRAMMRVLTPGAEAIPTPGPDPSTQRKLADLEAKVKLLEQEKRRAERMLYLTRKVLPAGPVKSGHRGRPRKVPTSASTGASGSRSSATTRNSTSINVRVEDGTADSTPRRTAVEPFGGTAS